MRTTREDTEIVKEQIIEKSIEMFTHRGFNATNMQDIADEIGLSKGPIYYHFKNKTELYNYVAKVYISEELERYKNIFNQDITIFEKITQDLISCTDGTIQRFIDDAYVFPELEEAKNNYIDFLNKIYDIKIESAELAIEKGELKYKDAENVVRLMFVFYYGITQMIKENNFDMSETDKKSLIDFFVNSLR